LALIGRGVAFEFRSKDKNPKWRSLWDWLIFIGSLVPALLIGVAFGNLVRGVPIDANMQYSGGFFNLLNWYALLAGVTTVVVFILYGAIFLSLKLMDELKDKAQLAARRMWPVAVVFLLALLAATYLETDLLDQLGVNPGVIPLAAIVSILLAGYFVFKKMNGWAFALTAITIAFSLVTMFLIMYPRVMISSIDPAYSLTIYNASSSQYTLTVMTVVAVIFVPIVLIYQGWSYIVFRRRLTTDSHLEY
jgi:cytochrome d ubiquinol oxidase subunit II